METMKILISLKMVHNPTR